MRIQLPIPADLQYPPAMASRNKQDESKGKSLFSVVFVALANPLFETYSLSHFCGTADLLNRFKEDISG
jgi:hypothetical protein